MRATRLSTGAERQYLRYGSIWPKELSLIPGRTDTFYMHWILGFGNLVAFAIGVIASVSVIGGVILLVVKVLTREEYRNRRRGAAFSQPRDKFIYRSSTADAPLE